MSLFIIPDVAAVEYMCSVLVIGQLITVLLLSGGQPNWTALEEFVPAPCF